MNITGHQSRHTLVAARLMLTAALLVFASTARANINYSIVDYPAMEADQLNSGVDTLSGTITTDGNIGGLTSADFVSGTLTFTYPTGSQTSVLNFFSVNGSVTATATGLSIAAGNAFSYQGANSNSSESVRYTDDYEGLSYYWGWFTLFL